MSFFTNLEGNFFVQTDRTEPFSWLTCTGVGDIEVPEADQTPEYCPDPLNSGVFVIEGFVAGDPSAGTYSLTKPLVSVYNFLLEQKCPFVGRVNWVGRGSRSIPSNYEIACLMIDSVPSRRGLGEPVRAPGGGSARVLSTMDLSYTTFMMIYRLTAQRQTVTNTADAYDVFFLPERCQDRLGDGRDACEVGFIGLENAAGYLYDAEVKKTTDGGATWAATAIDPFTYGGAIHAITAFETVDGHRIVAFRGEGVGGAQAECAVSEDGGATWTNHFMGGPLGGYIRGYALVMAKLLAVGSGGYIYASLDLGDTWSVVEAGTETTQTLNAVAVYNSRYGYAVGDSNAFLISTDGGETWAAGTGPAAGVNLLTVAVNDQGHVFVGGNDGRLYVSTNRGATWSTRHQFNGGEVKWVGFDPKASYVGLLLWNDTGGEGHPYRSEDGGATWQAISGFPTNSGLNGAHMCDQNNFFIVGDAHGGTTFIARVSPTY